MIAPSHRKIVISVRTLYFCFLVVFAFAMAFVMALEGTSSPFLKPKCHKEWPGLKLRLVAFDFDGTCTTKDTTDLFYKATEQYRHSTETTRTDLDKKWEELGNIYYKGHLETIKGLLTKVPKPSKHLDIEGLKEFLHNVYSFDSSCTKRVDESGLLDGITKEGLSQVAEQVELRPGCVNVLNKLNLPLHIISFNWSEDLINLALNQLKHFEVTANNFQFHNNKSRKHVGRNVSSPQDKEDNFNRLLQDSVLPEGFSVFIGDSIGDLLSLLKANVGIVIGNNTELRQVATAFGVQLVPLIDLFNRCYSANNFCEQEKENVSIDKKSVCLYETNSWNEIGEFLLGKSANLD